MNTVTSVTAAATADTTAQSKTVAGDGGLFSDMLAEALEKELQEKSVVLTGGPDAASQLTAGSTESGLTQMILAGAATGEAGEMEMALFMLCMMMQQEGNNELAPLMSAMSSMLAGYQGDKGALRQTVMSADFDPYILGTVDAQVFQTVDRARVPDEYWKPTSPAYTSSVQTRSAAGLRNVIDQFQVESAKRYEPWRDGNTYCNIFLWDVTRALGAEIPHYVDPATGAPRQYPDVKGARELNAPATQQWLLNHGAQYGWRQVSAEEAQAYANAGKPAVTTHVGQNGLGHVQVVAPSPDGSYSQTHGVTIAQAGSRNYNSTYITSVYSRGDLQNVKYFVHA